MSSWMKQLYFQVHDIFILKQLFYVVFLVKEKKRKCMCYLDVLFPSVEVYL